MKNRINTIALLITLAIAGLASGCEEEIILDVADIEPWYSVEGWVTTEPGPYTIRIQSTAPYSDTEGPDWTEGAFVTITDDVGAIDTLVEVSPGHYNTTSTVG